MAAGSTAYLPNMGSLHKGFSLTTSSSASFCSLAIISNPISSQPCTFHASSCRFLGKVEMDSVIRKTTALTEVLKAAKAMGSVKSPLTEKQIVQKTVASIQSKERKKEMNPKRLNSSASRRNPLDDYQILQYPLRSESAVQNIANNNTLVFVVDKRADKKNIRDAAEKMFKIQTRKVNTSVMPDGTKKAYIMLKPNYNASDIAKKIGVF